MRTSLGLAIAALGLVPAVAFSQTSDHMSAPAPAVNWGPAPPFLPADTSREVRQKKGCLGFMAG